jgi:uncharacterized protein
MSLADTLKEHMKAAMKAKDNATLSTLRLLLSATKNKEIDVQHELSDEEIQSVIKTQVKQLKDSIESFTRGGREDMAQSASTEVTVLEKYLPAQLSDSELEQVVRATIQTLGVTSKANMGKAMGLAMKDVAGRADGSRVKELVGRLLGVFVLVVGLGFLSTDVYAAIELTDTFSSGANYFEFMLRAVRVLMLWLGILAISMILSGGFDYMTASMRDDVHTSALTKITHGVFASLIIGALFAFATIVLQQIA